MRILGALCLVAACDAARPQLGLDSLLQVRLTVRAQVGF